MAATSPGTEKPASLEAVRTQLTLADDARAQAAEAHLKAALLAETYLANKPDHGGAAAALPK